MTVTMNRSSGRDSQGRPVAALSDWMLRIRDRLKPVSYLDWHEIPDEPVSPYRARLTLPPDQTTSGMEVREREVVRGKVNVVYEIRCSCRRRWFARHLERLQICPRCGSAVLLEPPESHSRLS